MSKLHKFFLGDSINKANRDAYFIAIYDNALAKAKKKGCSGDAEEVNAELGSLLDNHLLPADIQHSDFEKMVKAIEDWIPVTTAPYTQAKLAGIQQYLLNTLLVYGDREEALARWKIARLLSVCETYNDRLKSNNETMTTSKQQKIVDLLFAVLHDGGLSNTEKLVKFSRIFNAGKGCLQRQMDPYSTVCVQSVETLFSEGVSSMVSLWKERIQGRRRNQLKDTIEKELTVNPTNKGRFS